MKSSDKLHVYLESFLIFFRWSQIFQSMNDWLLNMSRMG